MKDYLKQIGQNIREVRQRRGLSLRQLGDLSGLSYVNISYIENGHSDMHLSILKKLADALGCDVKDFL